jgi:hypothetical protein
MRKSKSSISVRPNNGLEAREVILRIFSILRFTVEKAFYTHDCMCISSQVVNLVKRELNQREVPSVIFS